MALEFNADKQIIKSDELVIQNDTSVRFDVGGSADKKTAIFGSLSADTEKLVRVGINTAQPQFELDVNGQIRTTTSIISDTARINNLDIDTIVNPELNLKAPILNTFTDPDTGQVYWPTSQTPGFSDDSNKIATTNFVYNIATNDVGGRIYVSEQIGSDSFDGRSATKPVRTIKRATQLAAETAQKETLIVAGGDYLEDNPISLPDQCSVVGDNIRLCIIRPQNPGKHMFKASNENYVTGITFRDNLNSEGNPAFTWGYAYVFDDKQRFFYPKSLGGQYGRNFELGHKIAALPIWKLRFVSNNGGANLAVGLTVTNDTTQGTGVITEIEFDVITDGQGNSNPTDQSGFITINNVTGTINAVGADYEYTVGNTTYVLNVTGAEQLTPDAQVVKHVTTHPTIGLKTVKYDPINYPQGLIFTVVDGQYHDYEVGQYVEIQNMPAVGTFSDLSRFNGRQFVSHRIETADGFSTQFVVFKDTPTDLITLGALNGEYDVTANGGTVTSDDHYVVFSLDNSPVKFEESNKSPNRYLDAADLIGRNKEGIAAESLRRAKAEYTSLVVPDETQCRTDIGHIVDAINYDLTWGGNAATKEAADYYYDAGALTHIENQLKETTYAFEQARDLSIQAMRNQLNYVDYSSTGSFTRPAGYTGTYFEATWDNEKFIVVGDTGAIHTSPDGSTWTAQTSGTTENLRDIIWNKWAVGERGVPEYIAVGDNGTILWSNNGENWYPQTSGVSQALWSIAYNGSTYVIVGDVGTVLTSNNGTSWIQRTSGATNTLFDLIYNDDVDKFIAVGTGGTILESADGITWNAQESGTPQSLLCITWSEGRMIAAGNDGTICISDDGGLTWETNLVTTNVEADRYQDAADLILKNKKLIAAQAVYSYVDANAFTIPTGNQNCVDDVVDVLEAISFDLRHGGNAKSYDAASYYVGTSHVDGEEAQTVAIINIARDLAKDVMRNISITLSYLTDSTYISGLEAQFTTDIVQFTKPDISLDGSDPATACANVASSIDTLSVIITTAVTNDNLNHATRTTPLGYFNGSFANSSHDGNRFWFSSSDGSTQKVYVSEDRGRTWIEAYSTSGSNQYAFAFNYNVAIVAGSSGTDFIFDGVGTEIDASLGIEVYQDETISNTYDSNRFFACDNVANSLYTLWDIVINRINSRTVDATEYATSHYFDSNNKFFNVGHSYDDLPIIEVSPYIFNASVISFLGGGGCEIDGSKVATPNVKRPNLPPQGKSMVAAAFTIISFGGTGYRVFNDGYTQLVSVFCIFTQDGAFVESGGYASLTNSASNFGTYSLRASGIRAEAYSFHKGIIDNITFNDVGRPIFTVEQLGEAPLEHYIINPNGFELGTTAGQNPRYFIEETESATPTTIVTATVRANANMRVRGNYNRYTDASVLLENNARYIAEEAYFTTAATSSNSFDQNRDKCIRDVEEIVKAWAQDIKYDSNDSTWDAAKLYVSGSSIQHVAGYEAATKEVIDTATALSKKAINNLLQIKGSTAQTADYYVAQWTDEIPYVDTTVIHDISTAPDYVSGDCANVQSAIQTLSDLFDEIIDNPTVTTPMPGGTEREDGFFTINEFNKDKLQNHPIDFIRPSICNSSSHTWEFSGSGNDYNALPQNGGKRGSSNTGDFEQVSQLNGRVYASGTDELGDFKIGYFANVENRTGNITFGGTVEISEVSFLKIAGSGVTIEGFGPEVNLNAIELGGVAPGPSDSILPTQRAVYQYINNQLGIYIGRTYSTTPTPNALVQLDNSGRINIDQLPALRPFNIYTVTDEAERLAFEGPLAGDIVIQTATQEFNFTSSDVDANADTFTINNHGLTTSDVVTYYEGSGTVTAPAPLVDHEQYYAIVVDANTIKLASSISDAAAGLEIDITSAGSGNHIFETQGTPISFILNNDLDSQILEFIPDVNHTFTTGDITLATPGGGQGQVTNFLKGTVKQVVVNSGGSGYLTGDTVTFTSPSGGTAATGALVVNGGVITAVTLTSGGSEYYTAPSTTAGTITINTSTGSNANLSTIIRSRLSINILNNIKTEVTDSIDDQDTPVNTISLSNVVNTSGFNADNWIQLTSSTIDASFITSGTINPTRLAGVTAQNPANSLTYLRGDSLFAPAVSSLKISEESPIILGGFNSISTYIKSVQMNTGGEGYTVGTYTDTNLLGGNGQNLKGTIKVSNGTVSSIAVTNGGTGYTEKPTVTFKDNWTDPQNPSIINGISAEAYISGGQVIKINILDGGSGLDSNVPIIEITGGNGVDATATATVTDGAIQYIQITDAGANYTGSGGDIYFTITPNPAIIGTSPTTAADIEAYYATIPKLTNDITVDIARVNGNTPNANSYSTVGVAKFRKSDTGGGVRTGQFIIGDDGAIDIDQGQGSGFDADLLDNQDSSYYIACDNFVPGSSATPGLPANCLIGTYGIDIDGSADFGNILTANDTRSSTFQPSNFLAGGHFQWKDNNNNPGYANTWEYLEDGGNYHGVATFRRGGTGSTFSEGSTNQLAFTDNNNIYIRNSGSNQVNSLTITTGGSGYVNGTYYDVPLGGGDGFGLRANLTVTNGSFTNVELVDKGWGYNLDGNSGGSFVVVLPFSYFGTQNTRQITTPAVITATLPVYQSGAGQNVWSSWRKVWHDGNHGVGSGLDSDLFQGRDLRWTQKALNLSEDETLMNSKIPQLMGSSAFNNEIRITVPDPTVLIDNGEVYDIYIEGYNLTQEQIESLDTTNIGALGVGIQLNLYTANDIAEGTATLINRKINLDPNNRETGTQYVEQNYEWTANATFQRNDRVVYGHNVYVVSNSSSGGYTAGTVAPVHGSGTVTATSGTAQFTFERKVRNPYTMLTVEITSGNLTDSIKKIGILDAPQELYPVTDFAISSDETYTRRKARLGVDSTGTAFLDLGNVIESTSPYIDFNSSGNNVDFDVRIQASSGSSTVGTGILNFRASNAQVNGNNIWHAGNITFSSGFSGVVYDTNANSKAVLRDSSGNFAANNITANLTGIASGNLPFTGGTLTGGLRIKADAGLGISEGTGAGARLTITSSSAGVLFTQNDNSAINFRTDSSATQLQVRNNAIGGGAYVQTSQHGGVPLTINRGHDGGRLHFIYSGNTTSFGEVGMTYYGADGNMNLWMGSNLYSASNNPNLDGTGTHTGIVAYNQSRAAWATLWNSNADYFSINRYRDGGGASAIYVNSNLQVGINTQSNTTYTLQVSGTFAATSKSFVIDHPTKKDYQLVYGSLEGPEHGVYVRGKVTDGVIELPDYWTALVDEDTITVQLTAIGDSGNRWVVDVADNKITTGGGAAFYFVQAERKDIDKLTVEVEVIKEKE
jgi:hypothetical protein